MGERRGEAPPELSRVGEAGQPVSGRLLGAAVVAERVGERNRRAAREGGDRKEVLVGESAFLADQAEEGGHPLARCDRDDQRPTVGSVGGLAGSGGLGKPLLIEEFRNGSGLSV